MGLKVKDKKIPNHQKISKTEAKSIPLTQIYMNAFFFRRMFNSYCFKQVMWIIEWKTKKYLRTDNQGTG